MADLQRGVRPWNPPWRTAGPAQPPGRPRRANGEPYRGINVVLLWGDAIAKGFHSPTWMTYRQAQASGGQVRRGETGSLVVYADRYAKPAASDPDEDATHAVSFLKAYTVFNVEQIDGLAEASRHVPGPAPARLVRHAGAEAFFARTGARIRRGGNRAFYSPAEDVIQLPPAEAFDDIESQVATTAHELIHWTGHPSRLARDFGKRFGDRAYAFEELVAELGAAFLCADLGLAADVREDHAAYLASWIQVLQEDRRAIFLAAAQAQQAVAYLSSAKEEGEGVDA